jgi:predicted enzyme related to lactoylglutathione lyase
MSHFSRIYVAVIDVPAQDHDDEVAFWREATGQPMEQVARHPEYNWGQLHGQEFGILVQRLGSGPARIHLDIHTDDLAAEVARLEGLGARVVDSSHDWWILRDPAGLLFCVVPEPAGGLTLDNAQRWD